MNYFQPTYLNLIYKYQTSINKNTENEENNKIDIIKITNNELFSNYTLIYKRFFIILLILLIFYFIYFIYF